MLINSDFERHGFTCLASEGDFDIFAVVPFENLDDTHLKVRKLKKGLRRVELYKGNVEMECYEVMWSPEQLRLFLIFHKVIDHNEKLL